MNIIICHNSRFDMTSSNLQDVSLRKSTDEVGSVSWDPDVSLIDMGERAAGKWDLPSVAA